MPTVSDPRLHHWYPWTDPYRARLPDLWQPRFIEPPCELIYVSSLFLVLIVTAEKAGDRECRTGW